MTTSLSASQPAEFHAADHDESTHGNRGGGASEVSRILRIASSAISVTDRGSAGSRVTVEAGEANLGRLVGVRGAAAGDHQKALSRALGRRVQFRINKAGGWPIPSPREFSFTAHVKDQAAAKGVTGAQIMAAVADYDVAYPSGPKYPDQERRIKDGIVAVVSLSRKQVVTLYVDREVTALRPDQGNVQIAALRKGYR